MARVRDRTEDFKDAVRHSTHSLGYDEAKLASIMASFIIHKTRQRSPFTKAAMKTLESIGELEQFLLKHRKDYTDLHRRTEQERDSIEHEVSAFIKTCQEQIDVLKNSINDEEGNTKGWLSIGAGNSNADTIAHKHGVKPLNWGMWSLKNLISYVMSLYESNNNSWMMKRMPFRWN